MLSVCLRLWSRARVGAVVLLVELSRLLVSGAGAHRLFTVWVRRGGVLWDGARTAAALTLWRHVIDAHFARALRFRGC